MKEELKISYIFEMKREKMKSPRLQKQTIIEDDQCKQEKRKNIE
jgi:hypothetical protein